ncbi:MAG: class III extradiol ring-cleavage dioxygenase [Acidocella sp.]|nr:class III extradiol ring-cleavage dioxygenase [Acidocella sp.]
MIEPMFISHGSPMTALMDSPARHFLERLGTDRPRPRAILVASAHWERASPCVSAPVSNTTIHDFHGFPPALYALRYDPPAAPELAARAVELLGASGIPGTIDHGRGLDHGAWVPLMLAYPDADIPVAQISLLAGQGPRHHLAMGAALRPLVDQDVLVLGSGSFTHDLRRFGHGRAALDAPESADVTEFSDWMDARIVAGDAASLVDYRTRAPFAAEEHPTEEHLLPLFVAMGAAGADITARRLHRSVEFGFLRMDAYAFSHSG